jgi:aryl-alcohol dehydrogenase-like predicted oxidoreductase/enamine deaminase RidA (YjgF/YER057c/UK114 family)
VTHPPRTTIGRDLDISRIIVGLWQVADMERDGRAIDRDAAVRAMAGYLEAGCTTFDMADHYGSAEEITGQYIAGHGAPGGQFFTKWVPKPGPVSQDDVRAAVDRARSRMRVERIDLLQFHAWRYSDPNWLECLWWLDELRRQGSIREIGVTNVDAAHLHLALESGIPLVSNQVSYSLIDGRAGGALARLCATHGVRLLAYGTLAGGFLSARWLGRPAPGASSMTWSQMKYLRFIESAGGWDRFQGLLRVIDTHARRLGVSIANLACAAILERPGVAGVIIGARLGESQHIADNAALAGLRLDDECRAALAEATATLSPIPGDCGDEYRRPPFLTATGDLSHHLTTFPAPYAVATDERGRMRASSGTTWEAMAGYSRAVRDGRHVSVSGTTATHGARVVGGADPTAQAHFVIDKIEGALQSLGAELRDVVRTRVFVSDIAHWEAVARVHGERFRDIAPANTLVEARLVGPEYLVEIEADAIVAAS